MPIIKVKTKDGESGYVLVENWANPRIYLMDFQDEKTGDTFPKYRDELEYIGIEEL